jgi:hypothetical protein
MSEALTGAILPALHEPVDESRAATWLVSVGALQRLGDSRVPIVHCSREALEA